MRILSWNIQWGLGLDGAVDLGRIAAEIAARDPDVICLQEVSGGFAELKGNDGRDQFADLAGRFPGYCALSFAPVDMPGAPLRRRFGNLMLSRLPVGQVVRHTMPWDSDGVECMPRGLIEAVIEAPFGPVRVMTTHLEWSSPRLRAPQVEAILDIQRRAGRRAMRPPTPGNGPYRTGPTSAEAILLGDFNMTPGDPLVARLQERQGEDVPAFRDAWRVVEAEAAHPASSGLFDPAHGPPRCVDYAFVTEGLAGRVAAFDVDQVSRASDHQFLVLDLA